MEAIRFEIDYIENDIYYDPPSGLQISLWEPYRVGAYLAKGPVELAATYHTYYSTTDPDFGLGAFLCNLRLFNFNLSYLVGTDFTSWSVDGSKRIVAEINIADLILAKGTDLEDVLTAGHLILELNYGGWTTSFAPPPDMPDGAIQAFDAANNAAVAITPFAKVVGQIEPDFGTYRSAFYEVALGAQPPQPPDIFWTQRILCEETQ